MTLDEEKALVARAKKDEAAFGQLFDTYYPVIYRYILRRTADSALAQDIAAETFFKAYQNIRRYKWRGISINNWFYRIATNELRMYYRSQKYEPKSLEYLLESEGFEPISDADLQQESINAQDAVARQEQFVAAQLLLATLPVKYQEVITLRFVEKKKLSEIALILHKREGTVKSLLSRALSKVREQLAAQTQPNAESSIKPIEQQFITQVQPSYEE